LPDASVEAAPAAVDATVVPKRRGRPPKVRAEATEPVRTPEPEAPKRKKRLEPSTTGPIETLSIATDAINKAVDILRRATDLTLGHQEVTDATTSVVKALNSHINTMVHQDPPPPPLGNGQVDRPFDQALLDAAAQSVGIPLPIDDSVQ
jgi:hypothetical protein